MACFLVSAAEAVVVSGVEKHKEKVEKEKEEKGIDEIAPARIPWSRKLKWLKYMLWGGVILLAYEHVWHGEVVPWFPFLTAMSNPGDAAEMFHEMATVGVTMAVIITVTWLIMCKVSDAIMARKPDADATGINA
ncbi:MAG: hypothetical protein IJJ22_03905 [Oscillospiraceae bacterium]|nr:hypothetical protein [Oscillospiraceae bacterium]